MARNANSTRDLFPDDPRAVRFCVLGAARRAHFELELAPNEAVLKLAHACMRDSLPPLWGGDLTLFNDNPFRRKADVLALFDAACERVGGK